MTTQASAALTILRRKDVEARTGLARSTIYQRISAGQFPRPISLGARAVGWIEAEIGEWLAAQMAMSRKSTNNNSHH